MASASDKNYLLYHGSRKKQTARRAKQTALDQTRRGTCAPGCARQTHIRQKRQDKKTIATASKVAVKTHTGVGYRSGKSVFGYQKSQRTTHALGVFSFSCITLERVLVRHTRKTGVG